MSLNCSFIHKIFKALNFYRLFLSSISAKYMDIASSEVYIFPRFCRFGINPCFYPLVNINKLLTFSSVCYSVKVVKGLFDRFDTKFIKVFFPLMLWFSLSNEAGKMEAGLLSNTPRLCTIKSTSVFVSVTKPGFHWKKRGRNKKPTRGGEDNLSCFHAAPLISRV